MDKEKPLEHRSAVVTSEHRALLALDVGASWEILLALFGAGAGAVLS